MAPGRWRRSVPGPRIRPGARRPWTPAHPVDDLTARRAESAVAVAPSHRRVSASEVAASGLAGATRTRRSAAGEHPGQAGRREVDHGQRVPFGQDDGEPSEVTVLQGGPWRNTATRSSRGLAREPAVVGRLRRPGWWASSAGGEAAGARGWPGGGPGSGRGGRDRNPAHRSQECPVIRAVTVCPAPLVHRVPRDARPSGRLARSRSSASWSRSPGPCPPATTLTRRRQLTSSRRPGR